jgi:hypothetical protein
MDPPLLRVGAGVTVRGERTDSAGELWQFDATGLKPGTDYNIALVHAGGSECGIP